MPAWAYATRPMKRRGRKSAARWPQEVRGQRRLPLACLEWRQQCHGVLGLAKEVANAEEACKRAVGAVDGGHAGKERVEIAGHVARDQNLCRHGVWPRAAVVSRAARRRWTRATGDIQRFLTHTIYMQKQEEP